MGLGSGSGVEYMCGVVVWLKSICLCSIFSSTVPSAPQLTPVWHIQWITAAVVPSERPSVFTAGKFIVTTERRTDRLRDFAAKKRNGRCLKDVTRKLRMVHKIHSSAKNHPSTYLVRYIWSTWTSTSFSFIFIIKATLTTCSLAFLSKEWMQQVALLWTEMFVEDVTFTFLSGISYQNQNSKCFDVRFPISQPCIVLIRVRMLYICVDGKERTHVVLHSRHQGESCCGLRERGEGSGEGLVMGIFSNPAQV